MLSPRGGVLALANIVTVIIRIPQNMTSLIMMLMFHLLLDYLLQ